MGLPDSWFAARRGGRGRPSRQTLSETMQGAPARIALEVYRAELRLPTMAACREVAKRWRLPVDTVKRYAARYREALSWLPRTASIVESGLAEFDRRTLGMPPEVRAWLRQLPQAQVLRALRGHNIDGTCPTWVLEAFKRR